MYDMLGDVIKKDNIFIACELFNCGGCSSVFSDLQTVLDSQRRDSVVVSSPNSQSGCPGFDPSIVCMEACIALCYMKLHFVQHAQVSTSVLSFRGRQLGSSFG